MSRSFSCFILLFPHFHLLAWLLWKEPLKFRITSHPAMRSRPQVEFIRLRKLSSNVEYVLSYMPFHFQSFQSAVSVPLQRRNFECAFVATALRPRQKRPLFDSPARRLVNRHGRGIDLAQGFGSLRIEPLYTFIGFETSGCFWCTDFKFLWCVYRSVLCMPCKCLGAYVYVYKCMYQCIRHTS